MIETSVIYGLTGTILTFIAIIYGYKTIKNFQDDKEIAIRMLILDKKAKNPFILLSFGLMIFAIASAIDPLQPENETVRTARRTATILLFASITYFAYKIEHITRKHSQK